MEEVFKPLDQELKSIKEKLGLSKEEEDILKKLETRKENEEVLNQMRKSVRHDNKATEEEQ